MSFLKELSRRNVIRVAIAYAVVAWLLIEVAATTFPVLNFPDWSVTLLTALMMAACTGHCAWSMGLCARTQWVRVHP